jgi:predicted TIM-barrel fold metal-dependent hydrolase
LAVVDAQVHTWTPKDDPRYPWAADHPTSYFETQVTPHAAETVVADMDAAGVDAAITVVPRLYGWDNSYALDAARRFPDRIGVVGRIDWHRPDHVGRLRTLMDQPGMLGIRVTTRNQPQTWEPGGELAGILAAAEELDVPLSVSTGPESLGALAGVASRHPDLRLLVDHLGMEAPPTTVPVPGPEPFKHLPQLLELAAYPNLYVKLTAAGALSNEPFPFEDIWPAVTAIVDAFGPGRVLWGTDYNRTKSLLSYDEAVHYLEAVGFDAGTLAQLYGGTLQKVFGWPAA